MTNSPNHYIALAAEPDVDADLRDFQRDLRTCSEGALTGSNHEAYSEARFLQVTRIWFYAPPPAWPVSAPAGYSRRRYQIHRGAQALLAELLDQVLPPDSVQSNAVGARQFEQRYGLLGKPPMIRFRLRDPALYISGLHDVTVPLAQFMTLATPAARIIVTENESNMLAFPAQPGAMVIFGGGYAIDRLRDIAWLRTRELLYWSDIDTHGFAILEQERIDYSWVESVLQN